ncbi:MAG: 23S rRNA (guanosine(2251)-2'-O)-methyltransferase RlmB [Methylicorpusculum sp.]|uniref:23S rRNA (guanosine(2251)-2'-O)-methyltransferase RlmB n=1 Tax=Methylicorpusculum sp. TaxID=2713644 RepID=UPI00271906AB|nr:23S rRNA (guanosine(2251)-2'-O)-methyltransferase RlmB [Methylicorpusculum sp.]MDO8939742.1 23S rRNA (guanosine(2251)-2'-O)-methyltransferase RlmB [Methylicorpusculum sp.]MDO9240959.1 23S rRNA (guanosine(2251)-2'-O)-methyltransferase RlmB [Methylicorpusculum sp.]MDP2178373.1 23S rRNA (guanosine(2251)-2'-O)-methyltransferase RlmB [Methylicorpusculum sp.]MDP2201904.1 23S rRNA (guanosine(2251)-2'-O)-methyltransferase RlmB [Methylicorpusculum sp.]MDP3531463.1 23S rRNA (guanosine(2251)-2'-O)-met
MKLTKIYGLHSAQAALDYSAENILQVWVDGHRQDKRLSEIIKQVSDLGLNTEKADRKKLDRLAGGPNHQGIVIEIEMPAARSEDQLKTDILNITTPPLFLVLDNVQDPHNLGACLRTADATGVNGVIITKDNATGITPTVCKVASGAAETVPVYQITNLARTLRWLKDQGLWILGAAGDGDQTIYQADLKVPMALVIGAEGKGLRRLTREECDMLVKLPMLGKIESLNLSVATGVFLYEVVRQRMI